MDVEQAVQSVKKNLPPENMTPEQLKRYLAESQEIVVTQQIFKSLFPSGFVDSASGPKGTGSVELWNADPQFHESILAELLKAFAEGRVKAVIATDSTLHEKLSYNNQFEDHLHAKSQDYDKSMIIAFAFDKYFHHLSKKEQQLLQSKIIKYVDYIGLRKDNIVKILQSSNATSRLLKSPEALESLTRFLDEVAEEMRNMINRRIQEGDEGRMRLGAPPITEETIVVTTTSSGGAHRSIAAVIDDSLNRRKIPHVLVNESELVEEDNLKLFTGLHRNEVFNKVSQQSQQMLYGKQLKKLDDHLCAFIPDQRMDAFRRALGKSTFLVSTSHHPENVRAVAENGKRVCFQICDFGKIPDKLESIARATAKYKLSGITFFAPSERSTLQITKKPSTIPPASPRPVTKQKVHLPQVPERYKGRYDNYEEFVRVHRYPVHAAFMKQLDTADLLKIRQKFEIRPEARLWVLTMGSQGVGNALEHYLNQIIEGALKDIQHGKMTDLDVVILCGTNERLKRRLEDAFQLTLEKHCQGDAELLKKVKHYLHIKPLSKISLEEVAALGKASQAFLSKPGGGTAAEALLGEFPMIIHRDERHKWEFGNIEELIESGVTEIKPNENFYEKAKSAARARAPNPYTTPEDCVDYAIEVLWKLEQQRF